MDVAKIEQAADLLAESRTAPRPFDSLPKACRPTEEADGYAVQRALARRLTDAGHGPVIGAKIGCTTPVMQSYMKIGSPCAGTMFRDGLHPSPAVLPFSAFRHVGVECEIAVRLSSALPEAETPVSRDDVADCVESCMAAIEIVDDRYRDFRSLDTPTLIADDFFHAGCVLGKPIEDWRSLDLASVEGRMIINGERVGTGLGDDILGHPLNALAWLAESGQAAARSLGAGSIVMLGSVVQTVWVSKGDRISVEIGELGRAEVRFR